MTTKSEIKYTIDPVDVHWTMDWREFADKDPEAFGDKPATEEVYEEPGMLAVLIANGWIGMNNHWWEKDWPEKAREQFCIFLNMNDIFAWACADAEEITFSELKDVYLHFEKDTSWGPVIWACKKRRMLPQQPITKRMREDGVDMEALTKEIEELKNDDERKRHADVCAAAGVGDPVGHGAPDHPQQQPNRAADEDNVGAG